MMKELIQGVREGNEVGDERIDFGVDEGDVGDDEGDKVVGDDVNEVGKSVHIGRCFFLCSRVKYAIKLILFVHLFGVYMSIVYCLFVYLLIKIIS